MAFCTYCGKEISDAAAMCPNCGHPQHAVGALVATGPRTEPTAVASMCLGIAGFLICPLVCHIIAVILGNQARARLREDPTLEGDGMAKAGIILGWVGIGLFVLFAVGIVFAIMFAPDSTPDFDIDPGRSAIGLLVGR